MLLSWPWQIIINVFVLRSWVERQQIIRFNGLRWRQRLMCFWMMRVFLALRNSLECEGKKKKVSSFRWKFIGSKCLGWRENEQIIGSDGVKSVEGSVFEGDNLTTSGKWESSRMLLESRQVDKLSDCSALRFVHNLTGYRRSLIQIEHGYEKHP